MRYIFFLFLICVLSMASGSLLAEDNLNEDLIYHINFGSNDDIELLLRRGANPNTLTKLKDPVLSVAIARNDKEAQKIVISLLNKGADANQKDSNSVYPLALAIKNKQVDSIIALINKGANVHAIDTNGKTMLELAQATQEPSVVYPIQEYLDKEKALDASMRSNDNFKLVINKYAFNSCAYQYWGYFLASRQDVSKDPETQKKINGVRSELESVINQIQRYFPTTKTSDLQLISDSSAKTVYNDLESMQSNEKRASNNVGKDEDAQQRCQKIADGFKINFAPLEDKK